MINKTTIFTTLTLSVSFLLNAQIYTPSAIIQGTSGNNYVGVGTSNPTSNLEIVESSDSRPGGQSAPTKSILKLSRNGTGNYSWPESAEFRIGHGGNDVYGSKLDLFIKGGSNTNSAPNQHVMTWNYNGNVGLGTTNPQNKLQVGDFNDSANSKISIPGVYNFEQMVLGQYGNGASGLEMITHSGSTNSFGVRLFASIDTGANGLLIQTADPANSAQNLIYTTKLVVSLNGNVGIGTTNPTAKLTVAGNIESREVKVTVDAGADFVFENDYNLRSLDFVDKYIQENKHLPEITSADEMKKDGINLSEMNIKLLQKIEEMTLYLIEMKKENEKQNEKIVALKDLVLRVTKIENELAKK